jgi:hypothetical protein
MTQFQTDADFAAQVPAGYHFTIDAMRKMATRICNKDNWKMPIAATLPVEPTDNVGQIAALAYETVHFMMGGGASISFCDTAVVIVAPGYYAKVGA